MNVRRHRDCVELLLKCSAAAPVRQPVPAYSFRTWSLVFDLHIFNYTSILFLAGLLLRTGKAHLHALASHRWYGHLIDITNSIYL